jgi:hypothetical protein
MHSPGSEEWGVNISEDARVRSFSRKSWTFLEKVGLFWKKPYFFSDGQVLVV